MKYYNKLKKAFTLVEIALAVLIIAILVLLTMPIIINQMQKTDEYAYFSAYKLVEKISSQVVMYGDESVGIDPTISLKNDYNPIIPAAMADYKSGTGRFSNDLAQSPTLPNIYLSFPETFWNYLKVCAGTMDGGTYPYNASTYNKCGNYFTGSGYPYGDLRPAVKRALTGKDTGDVNLSETAEEWCRKLGNGAIISDADSYYVEYIDRYPEEGVPTPTHECIVVRKDKMLDNRIINAVEGAVNSFNAVNSCDRDHGYIDAGATISNASPCLCDGVWATNNPRVCCPRVGEAQAAYYYKAGDRDQCIACTINAFNEVTNSCCPRDSSYNAALRQCVCNSGYRMIGNTCIWDDTVCPPGSHLSPWAGNHICQINRPYIGAQRLCSRISQLWNTVESNCDSPLFTARLPRIYNAATNVRYLSVNARQGAFRNVTPHLIFANGMRMWFLGDRAATIPGLSYNPEVYTNRNDTVCQFDAANNSEGACTGGSRFYCRDEGRCYSVTTQENGPALVDARTCCANPHMQTIRNASYVGGDRAYRADPRIYAISGFTVFVDIDGAGKGTSTLWDDIFPFYIATDGQVYPGYPLNAPADSRQKNIAGNGSYLNADVYYYEKVEDTNTRKKTFAYMSIPMARAVCFARLINVNTPYCQNLGTNYREYRADRTINQFVDGEDNPCSSHKCYINVKNKVKFL